MSDDNPSQPTCLRGVCPPDHFDDASDETDTTSEVARVLNLHASFKASAGIQTSMSDWWWECDGCSTKVAEHGTARVDVVAMLAAHQAAMLSDAGLLQDGGSSCR